MKPWTLPFFLWPFLPCFSLFFPTALPFSKVFSAFAPVISSPLFHDHFIPARLMHKHVSSLEGSYHSGHQVHSLARDIPCLLCHMARGQRKQTPQAFSIPFWDSYAVWLKATTAPGYLLACPVCSQPSRHFFKKSIIPQLLWINDAQHLNVTQAINLETLLITCHLTIKSFIPRSRRGVFSSSFIMWLYFHKSY